MELTIKEALQQAIAAHKEGRLKEAEGLYRAILQSQPKHPDANHNLGVLKVSVNKSDAALILFKTAIETNPKIEQFWLSYIDALIKEKQFDDAKQVLEQAKKQGVAGGKLNALKAQLIVNNQTENVDSIKPSQEQLDSLLEHYQNGRFDDAEKLAVSVTQEFPQHQFAWKVLGAVLKQTGRVNESLDASQKSVQLAPQDPEAHSNFGVILKELGKLDEAEASYTQAIALNPDYVQAHNNLGIMLQVLGRLDEAEASYKQAIALRPDFAEAQSNLGVTLTELGRLDEAEASLRQAITLKADYPEPHNNLGNIHKKLGRLDEAEASYKQAIALKSDFAEAHNNLGNALKELGGSDEAEASYKQAIALKSDYDEAHYNLGILLFERKQYNLASEHFDLCDSYQSKMYAIKCSYFKNEKTSFYKNFDSLVNKGEINAVIGSLAFCSEFKYGIKKSNPFCNEPLKYVVKTDLNKRYDFENIFIETARDVLADNSMSYKAQGHLTNGVQTAGNIFEQGKVPKTEIESIIRKEIEKYRFQFKDSKEGFLRNWPTSYEIKGWLVCMQRGGKLDPHMHDTGWITGSIYINVPPKTKIDSGNLVLCLSDREHALGFKKSQESIIDIVTGSLCLFPSSLHHYTIPFEEKENRIVLAFDVIPKI